MSFIRPSLRRPLILLILISLTGLICFCVAKSFAINLPGRTATLPHRLGHIERLQLPNQNLKLEDAYIELEVRGVDDFSRLYVNNYLVFGKDWPVVNLTPGNPDFIHSIRVIEQHETRRAIQDQGMVNLGLILREGSNFIVFEVWNSPFGYCSGTIEIRVNRRVLPTFPRTYPIIERATSLFPNSYSEVSPLLNTPNGLCARNVFEIYLEPATDTLFPF